MKKVRRIFVRAAGFALTGQLLFAAAVPVLAEDEESLEKNTDIEVMMELMTQEKAMEYMSVLTGEKSAVINGKEQKINGREAGEDGYQLAVDYVSDFLEKQGMIVEYQTVRDWDDEYQNVIGEIKGTKYPDEVVIMCAHLDSINWGLILEEQSFEAEDETIEDDTAEESCEDDQEEEAAPGADDNASGSTGVMLACEAMSGYQFERTVRFVFFGGEELGLVGSDAYTKRIMEEEPRIIAAINLDMIGWDKKDGPVVDLAVREEGTEGREDDLVLAGTFVDVLNTYGFSETLEPYYDETGMSASDHGSFWAAGIPSICVIEDFEGDDYDRYMHTERDVISELSMEYLTDIAKVSMGTVAVLAGMPSAEE